MVIRDFHYNIIKIRLYSLYIYIIDILINQNSPLNSPRSNRIALSLAEFDTEVALTPYRAAPPSAKYTYGSVERVEESLELTYLSINE